MDLLVDGMHGLGDNVHQRAVVRALLRGGHRVVLRTPWPQLYTDLMGQNLQLLPASSKLRTQAKNEAIASGYYANFSRAEGARRMRVWYPPEVVRAEGSVLGAMLRCCGLAKSDNDFRLTVPTAWTARAKALLEHWKPDRPVMVYRPLVERTEWSGCHARNPDAYAYGTLAAELRKRFFVVSVADLVPDREWISGADIDADVKLHAGELGVEALIGLIAEASLVYCSPGFAVIVAQAVGTPAVCVFGGYEDSASFSLGACWAPYLGIDTIRPCRCFSHDHACEKRIDIDHARRRIDDFTRPLAEVPARAA